MYEPQITAERIKLLSQKKGISIAKLQEKCELSRNVISQSAKSSQGIKAKNLYLIAEVLECSVDYLLGRTDDPSMYSNTNIEITGDNNNSVNSSGSGNNIQIGSDISEQDATTQQFLEIFNNLPFGDRIQLMYKAIELDVINQKKEQA